MSQTFAGEIPVREVLEEGRNSTSLVVDKKQELSYSVKYTNTGSLDLSDVLVHMGIGKTSDSTIEYENLSFECVASGGAECPLSYRKADNIPYTSTGVFL